MFFQRRGGGGEVVFSFLICLIKFLQYFPKVSHNYSHKSCYLKFQFLIPRSSVIHFRHFNALHHMLCCHLNKVLTSRAISSNIYDKISYVAEAKVSFLDYLLRSTVTHHLWYCKPSRELFKKSFSHVQIVILNGS